MIQNLPPDRTVVFFDGVCGLCNTFVDWVLQRDRKGAILFTPLQGVTAAQVLERSDVENLSSVVVFSEGQIFRRSDAVVVVLRKLGGPWSLFGSVLRIVPSPLRDFGYSWVAKTRYQLFGKKESCRLPTPEERARFLN